MYLANLDTSDLDLDGVNQWEALSGADTDTVRDSIVLNYDTYNTLSDFSLAESDTPTAAVIFDTFKMIVNEYNVSWYDVSDEASDSHGECATLGASEDKANFLFDLNTDTGETTNMYDDDTFSAIKFQCEFMVEQAGNEMVDSSYAAPDKMAFDSWKEYGFIVPWLDDSTDYIYRQSASTRRKRIR
jgi:hypothetical protein